MELYFRKIGEAGTPLIILHGLYGSSDNWLPIGRKFAENFQVYLVDQRNHGKSPHTSRHNYYLMRDDLREFMVQQNIEKATIIGHSMGGKTAMFFADKYPEMVSNLVVVDISPKSYRATDNIQTQNIEHLKIIQAMKSVDFSKAESIRDVDLQLQEFMPEQRLRQFLLKNITRIDKKYCWAINLNTIANELPSVMDGFKVSETESHTGHTSFPVLFIKGNNSSYILEEDKKLIKQIFPYAQIEGIANAGHWVHAEQSQKFMEVLLSFLI